VSRGHGLNVGRPFCSGWGDERLNAHDVDAVVELFTGEDAGPAVTADRLADQQDLAM